MGSLLSYLLFIVTKLVHPFTCHNVEWLNKQTAKKQTASTDWKWKSRQKLEKLHCIKKSGWLQTFAQEWCKQRTFIWESKVWLCWFIFSLCDVNAYASALLLAGTQNREEGVLKCCILIYFTLFYSCFYLLRCLLSGLGHKLRSKLCVLKEDWLFNNFHHSGLIYSTTACNST